MAFVYKKQDDLEKLLGEFASFDILEEIDLPESKPNQDDMTDKDDKKVK